jgi:hypothetical protein
MVHERDEKYEGHEDGEYHFSDDQANYEIESDIADHSVVSARAPNAKDAIQQYKRPIIGVVVFVLLIFLVYKISAPPSTTPASDFGQNTGSVDPVKKVATPIVTPQPSSSFQPLAQPTGMSTTSSVGVTAPVAQPLPVQNAVPVMPSPQQPKSIVMPVVHSMAPAEPATATTTTTTTQSTAPVVIINQEPAETAYNPAHPSTETKSSFMVEPTEIVGMNQKLTTLTQQNAQLQAEYKQKTADYEQQNSELQSKVQNLNARIAGLETTLAHLGRSIQDTRTEANKDAAMTVQSPAQVAAMRPIEPRITYTVQAIIPGRAWLKSESGETVTVAEGDTLKGYGRIVKIDPYDGVVDLEMGGKVITLSYGATNE